MVGKEGVAAGKKKNVILIERKKSTSQEEIKSLEKQIADTKYNKKTQHAIGMYKAKLALLKEKSSGGKGGGAGYERFNVRKTGEGTVVLLGFPSVGKSTLLNKLTNAKSDIAAYAFTTLAAVPGVMLHKHAKIQVVDVPGIVSGAASGKGRGKEVLTMLRSADLVLILIDVQNPEHYPALLKEAHEADIRMNEKKPDIVIAKKDRGGLTVSSLVKLTQIDQKTIEDVSRMFKLLNADILFKDDASVDQFIDILEGNKIYNKALVVFTKIDLIDDAKLKKLSEEIHPDVMISAENNIGIEDLKDAIFNKMNFMRIYLKEIGKKPDMEVPIIMFRGSTIKDVCSKLHKDFVENFRFARVWGKSAKFDGQIFKKLEKTLEDNDILELHIR